MTVLGHLYAKSQIAVGGKLENLTSDAMKVMLLSAYTTTAAQQTHEFVADVLGAGTETSGVGYTTGGLAITSPTLTAYTGSSSVGTEWSTAWAASTSYALGAIVRPSTANNYLYQAVVAGTSGSSAPTFPTVVGTTVTDSGVTWLNIGLSVVVWTTATNPVWNSGSSAGTLSAAYAVFYDSTPGSNATNPVLGYWDLGGTQTATNAPFTLQVPSAGIFPWATS